MSCRCPFTMLRVLSCSFSPQTLDNPNRPLSRLPQPAILFLYSDLEQLTIRLLSDSSLKMKNRLIHCILYLAAPLQNSTYSLPTSLIFKRVLSRILCKILDSTLTGETGVFRGFIKRRLNFLFPSSLLSFQYPVQ